MKIHKITMKANIIYISQLYSIIWYIIYFYSNSLLLKDNQNQKYSEEKYYKQFISQLFKILFAF